MDTILNFNKIFFFFSALHKQKHSFPSSLYPLGGILNTVRWLLHRVVLELAVMLLLSYMNLHVKTKLSIPWRSFLRCFSGFIESTQFLLLNFKWFSPHVLVIHGTLLYSFTNVMGGTIGLMFKNFVFRLRVFTQSISTCWNVDLRVILNLPWVCTGPHA